MPMSYVIRSTLVILQAVQKQVELCISATATGPARNKLCDANIHLGSCIRLLKELSE